MTTASATDKGVVFVWRFIRALIVLFLVFLVAMLSLYATSAADGGMDYYDIGLVSIDGLSGAWLSAVLAVPVLVIAPLVLATFSFGRRPLVIVGGVASVCLACWHVAEVNRQVNFWLEGCSEQELEESKSCVRREGAP